jgi:uncharacterized OB-fold protein
MSQTDAPSQAVETALEENRLNHEIWEEALTDGTVLGLRCEDCEYVTATPKAACPRCGCRSISVVELPDTGTVYTKTTIEVAPEEHGSGYQLALIDLREARLMARIADDDHVEIDDEVELSGTFEYAGDLAAVFESRE